MLAKIRKAIAGGIIAGAGTLAAAAQSDGVTQAEWLTVGAAVIVGVLGVWATPNRPAAPTP